MAKYMKYITFLLLIVSGSAYAEGYLGLQYSSIRYSDQFVTRTDLPTGILRIGNYVSPNSGFELRYGTALDKEQSDILGISYDVIIPHMVGIYALAEYDVFDFLSVYGVVGYTENTVRVTGLGGFDMTRKDDDASYGVGVDLNMGDSIKLNIEWMNYLTTGLSDVDGFTAGFTFIF